MAETAKTPDAKEPAQKGAEAGERGRDRSPSFPFISLEDAVGRAETFETTHRRHPARIAVAAQLWSMSATSSTMQQTVAALKAYGLMKDSGSGSERKIELTDLAQRILKDARPGNRQAALKEAALKPRLIAQHWNTWGAQRPPDATCLSDLHLDQKFTQDAAARFLRVYDATIGYAGLTASDKPVDMMEDIADPEATPPADNAARNRSSGIGGGAGVRGGVSRVLNERMVFSQEIEAQQSLKVLVSGPVDEALLDALEDFVEFQRNRLKRSAQRTAAITEAAGQDETTEQ